MRIISQRIMGKERSYLLNEMLLSPCRKRCQINLYGRQRENGNGNHLSMSNILCLLSPCFPKDFKKIM